MDQTTPASYQPFDHIPNELLAIILIYTSDIMLKRSTRDAFSFPFVVAAQVSRRWKGIAQGTPQLWTTIRVDRGSTAEKTKKYLSRSRSLWLDIEIRDARMDVVQTINQHAKRCRSLSIRGKPGGELSGINMSGIMLEYTNLQYFDSIAPNFCLNINDLAASAHSIRSVSLMGHHLILSMDSMAKPLSALTELVLDCSDDHGVHLNVPDVVSMLRNAPILRRLVAANLPISVDLGRSLWVMDVKKPVDLIHLEEMVLVDLFPLELISFIGVLKCPNLRTLGFGCHYDVNGEDSMLFANLSPGWVFQYPRLKEIFISPLHISSVHMLSHLPAVPLLGVSGPSAIGEDDESDLTKFFIEVMKGASTAMVSVLMTRGIGTRQMQCILDERWFPNIKKIRIYYGDFPDKEIQDVTDRLHGLVEIESWGKDDGNVRIDGYLGMPRDRAARRESWADGGS